MTDPVNTIRIGKPKREGRRSRVVIRLNFGLCESAQSSLRWLAKTYNFKLSISKQRRSGDVIYVSWAGDTAWPDNVHDFVVDTLARFRPRKEEHADRNFRLIEDGAVIDNPTATMCCARQMANAGNRLICYACGSVRQASST